MGSDTYRFVSVPYHVDRKLYKYYSNVQYAADCIRKRRIHLDDPKSFNDPFDAVIPFSNYIDLTTTETEIEAVDKWIQALRMLPLDKQSCHHWSISQKLLEAKENGRLFSTPNRQSIRSIIENVYTVMDHDFSLDEFTQEIDVSMTEQYRVIHLSCRISCFSEIRDSILMWSYYGNSHKGVCIEFDISQLDRNDERNRGIINSISKVHYSPLRADVKYSRQSSEWNFLTTKADVWQHEHEWRLICNTEEEFLPFDCISGVFLGAKFDLNAAKYKDLLRAVDTHKGLVVQQCKLSLDKYRLEFSELYSSTYGAVIRKNAKEPALTY